MKIANAVSPTLMANGTRLRHHAWSQPRNTRKA
jgi:hypothetical protein